MRVTVTPDLAVSGTMATATDLAAIGTTVMTMVAGEVTTNASCTSFRTRRAGIPARLSRTARTNYSRTPAATDSLSD